MPLWNTPPDWFDLELRLDGFFPNAGFGMFNRQAFFHSHNPNDHYDTHPAHRLKCVKDAFFYATTPAMLRLGRRFAEIDIREVAADLLESVAEMARILVASMLLGGAIGGAVGGLAGGVGAIPGVAMGTALGLKAGGWVLSVLGLSAIADFVIDGLPTIVAAYHRGVNTAWLAPPQNRLPFSHSVAQEYLAIQQAGEQIAEAHEAMVILLLSGIVAYLTRHGGAGAGLLRQMSKTSRGERLAMWVAKHEQALKQHPLLKVPEPAMAMAGRPVRHESSAPASATVRDESTRPRRGRRMARFEVPCFSAKRMPHSKIAEFDRQLMGQEKGLNALTIDEYVRGRAAFTGGNTKRNTHVAQTARARYEEYLTDEYAKKFVLQGDSSENSKVLAAQKAKEKMRTLAALHNPDLITGGADNIEDFGDRQVNSSIGAQWKKRVKSMDEAAEQYYLASRRDSSLNVKLDTMNAGLVRCGSGEG
jgi:hypothetical protein